MEDKKEMPLLILTDSMLRFMHDVIMGASPGVETGVTLFGTRDANCRVVLRAVGPGPSAIHRPTFFQPDVAYLNTQFEQLRAALPSLHWIGSFHLHPPGMRWLSERDQRTVQQLLNDETLGLPDFVAGILQRYGTRLEIEPYLIQPGNRESRPMTLQVVADDTPLVQQARQTAGASL